MFNIEYNLTTQDSNIVSHKGAFNCMRCCIGSLLEETEECGYSLEISSTVLHDQVSLT